MALPAMQHAADAKHCRRCGAPYRYDADLPRPPRPLPLRQLRRDAPRAAGRRPHDVVLEGVRGARFTLRTPAGDARDRAAPARALQRLQRARRRRAGARARRRRSTTSTPACTPSPPPSGAPRRVRVGGRDLSILLVKNPAGANEVLRTLDARARRARPLRRAQRQHRRRARRQLGLGRRLRGPRPPRAPRDVQRHPRRRDGAAPEVRGRRPPTGSSSSPSSARAWTAPLGDGDGRALRPADLHRDARAARPARRARRRARSRFAQLAGRAAVTRGRSGTTSSAAATTTTCRCGASWPTARARRCSTSAPGTGRVALDLARRGHEVVALDRDAELLAALRERARRPAGRDRRGRRARASTSAGASRWSSCRCRRSSCSAAPRAARASCACARAHLAPGGLLAVALADALEAFDDEHDQPPPPDLREVGGVVYASRPVAVRDLGDRAAIERVREIVGARRHAAPTRTTSSSSTASTPTSSRPRRAAFGLRAEPPRRDPRRPTSTSARRW